MKPFLFQYRTVVGIGATIFALSVAALYVFVLPLSPENVHPLARVILHYGHSFCWLLLAVAAGLFAAGARRRSIELFAYAALASYGVFIATYIVAIII